uniref:Uncharacterized protein n=1 Tax=Corvus moneduloides TaxID=1196302 RepID=A0A8U7P0T4_CORMO
MWHGGLSSPSPHLILPALQGQTPEAERRREGGTLNVECPYKAQTEDWHAKYWCLVTNTGWGQSTAREGSVRIQDDTQQGIVTITMEQLQVQDSGVYWCALQESSGLSRMEEVTLSVSKGGYGSVRTQSEIPDSFPCSLPLGRLVKSYHSLLTPRVCPEPRLCSLLSEYLTMGQSLAAL